MNSGRCAACKYLRRRCPKDCIFSPYFPPTNPQRFSCVHRIFGASNVGKMLQQLPEHLREEAADTLYYEAQCRIENPVYGCVGIITQLHEQINDAERELARAQAQIAFHQHSPHPQPQQQVQVEVSESADITDSSWLEQNEFDSSALLSPLDSTWFF
ncbi:LOB domain-containing protein [Heracleum sosnowskyi]|uniref:LOB domain-containing protein n=1 Tax=Heracleum sosnowskyi TaxID=360622 RepID=A0AAD8HGY0_9APIA|nr:LOB domain-containing protein [Heracleum sosnowskyi]